MVEIDGKNNLPPSFPISLDKPNHHRTVCNSVYQIVSRDEHGKQAAPEHLAAVVSISFQRPQVNQLRILIEVNLKNDYTKNE